MFTYAITGASGFVGQALIEELKKNFKEPVVLLKRKTSPLIFSQKEIPSLILDEYENFSEKIRADVLFHLAWDGVQNIHRNSGIQTGNRVLMEQVCRCAKKMRVKNIVALGSQAEYGVKNKTLFEDEPLTPTTLYGEEKVRAFHLLKSFCQDHRISFQWMRLFSSYGPQDHPSWLIPSVIIKCLKDENIPLTKGDQFWDYLYVEDVAKALLAVSKKEKCGIYNLASGKAVTIKEVATLIQKKIKTESRLLFGEVSYRSDQIFYLHGNIDKIIRETDWRPQMALDEGIRRTIEFFSQS